MNEKLEIQVTTINSETLHKINYSFASEARMWISDSRCHLSRAAQYTRRLKSQIFPRPPPGLRPLRACGVQMINSEYARDTGHFSLNGACGKSPELERDRFAALYQNPLTEPR